MSGSQSSSPRGSGSGSDITAELAAMREALTELQQRLARFEGKVRSGNRSAAVSSYSTTSASKTGRLIPLTHSPWLAGVNASLAHPSQEKFGVEEAVVSELVDFFEKEKTCSVEPGGKPCDHCEMCSSRGF